MNNHYGSISFFGTENKLEGTYPHFE